MNKKMIPVIVLTLLVSALYGEVLPSLRYELTKEEHSKLSRLIADSGHAQEATNIAADKYENGNIIINVKLKPISKKKYKEMTCLCVDYTEGKMKISNTGRMVCYDSTDFYFAVGPEVEEEVIDKAMEKYLSIMKNKEFDFIKLGKIHCLYQKEDSYTLSIVIQEETRYAFSLILDMKNPNNLRRIEIEPLPML